MKRKQKYCVSQVMLLVVCCVLIFDCTRAAFAAEAASAESGRIVTPAEAAKARAEAEAARLRELQTAQPKVAPKPAAQPVPVSQQRDLEKMSPSLVSVGQIIKMPGNFVNVDSLAWSPDGKRLLIDRLRKRYYEIVEVEVPDKVTPGSRLHERVLCENGRESTEHKGNPIWIPGRPNDIVFVKQLPGSRDYFSSMPWYGWYCTLEAGNTKRTTSDTLIDTTFAPSKPRGVASPCISADGSKLFWVSVSSKTREKGLWGNRKLNMGSLSMKGKRLELTGTQTIELTSLGAFITTCGISPDGRDFLFSANDSKNPWYATDLYVWNLGTGNMRKLTTGGWNTWGCYSPKGTKILWGASRDQAVIAFGAGGVRWQKEVSSDLWIMGSDGSEAHRLTYFNKGEHRDAQAIGVSPYEHCYVGNVAWRPNSRQVAAVVYHGGRKNMNSVVVLLELTDARGNR